nr:hypothetical protein BaRGS_025239 [Batillaria attramentaria]
MPFVSDAARQVAFYACPKRCGASSVTMALHKGALQILENNVGVSDAVLLDPMTEDAFIKNLQERFHHQQIYP